MASVRTYRKKIKSAKSIAKITKAMQLVAASKMKKAQISAASGKEYSAGIIELASVLSNFLDAKLHPLLSAVDSDSKKQLIVLVAPEKGLCGGLVTNLTRFLNKYIEVVGRNNVELVAIGKKAKLAAKRMSANVIAEFEIGLSSPSYELVPPIARLIEDRYLDGGLSQVTVVYPDFVNTMVQTPKSLVLLPLQKQLAKDIEEEQVKVDYQYKFEPDPKSIVDPLLGMYLETEIYQILLESFASEQSARMVAMKNATDNAESLIDTLSIEYNKMRQSGITNEILDIGNASAVVANQ